MLLCVPLLLMLQRLLEGGGSRLWRGEELLLLLLLDYSCVLFVLLTVGGLLLRLSGRCGSKGLRIGHSDGRQRHREGSSASGNQVLCGELLTLLLK